MTCLRLASLIAFVLWSSPITKLAIKLFPYNAPEEYLLVAQKDIVNREEKKNRPAEITLYFVNNVIHLPSEY